MKTLCCLCCASGPITGRITCLRQGYVPGENIEFHAELENKSSRRVVAKAALRMVKHR